MAEFYSDEIIEEVRLNNDIVDVISEYIKLEKKGSNYFGLCPFHNEKTPSFSVEPNKQYYHCFGCGQGGNVYGFIMHVENLDFLESLKLLADRVNISLPQLGDSDAKEKEALQKQLLQINVDAARMFYKSLFDPHSVDAQRYIKKRGLSKDTIKRFGIGYASSYWDTLSSYLLKKGYTQDLLLQSGLVINGQNGKLHDRFRKRIMFPITNIRGNIIGFGGRVIDDSMPKYMNSPETLVYHKGKELYGLNIAKNTKQKRMLIVEGYMDVISLHQSGIDNVVASLGTALTQMQGRVLKKYTEEVVISYDADSAGQAAAMKGVDILNGIGCRVKVLSIPEGKDPDEFIKKNGSEKFKLLVEGAISLVEYKIRNARKQFNLEDMDSKIKFLNTVATILLKVENNVEREMYVNKISKEYGISVDSLNAEIYRLAEGTTKNEQYKLMAVKPKAITKANKNIEVDRIVQNEMLIMAFICNDNSVFYLIKERFKPEEFCEVNQAAAKMIYQRLTQNKGIIAAELLNMIDDKYASAFTTQMQRAHSDGNVETAILDVYRQIELDKLELLRKKISSISNNEGDVELLNRVLKEISLKKKK